MSINKKFLNISAGASAACTTDSTDPFGDSSGVALYNLDYDASEASGYYDGEPSNVEFGVGGQINYGARFNGSTSIINLSTYSAISQQNNFSLSFWLKPNGFVAYSAIVKFYSNYRNYVEVGLNGILGFNATGSQVNTPSGSITDGVWQHVAITKSSTDGTVIYVNNVAVVTSSSDTGNASDFSSNNYINYLGGWDGSVYGFPGDLDQVRVFSKALNQTEVGKLYAETACVYTSTTDIVNYPTGTTPVAYYKMDNSSEDYAGTNDGSDSNIEYRFGRFGQAAVFNGSSSYINIDNSTVFDLTTYSVSFWIYSSDYNQSAATVYNGGIDVSGGSWGGLAFGVNSNKFYYYGGDVAGAGGSGFFTQTGVTNLTNGQWVNVVMIVNGTSITGYINGTQDTGLSRTLGANIVYRGQHKNTIGVRTGSFGSFGYFNGSIDQFRFYNTALSSADVTDLYNEKPEVDTSNFKAVLYEANASTNFISNVGMDLETNGGLVWLKSRDNAYNYGLFDSVRGANNLLQSNTTAANNGSVTNTLNSFEKTGFFLGANENSNYLNNTSSVAWNWKAGGDAIDITSSSSNVSVSSLSANAVAGFSIATYTTNSNSPVVIPHGLDSTPEVALVKRTDSNSDWFLFNTVVSGKGRGFFNSNSAFDNAGLPTLDGTNITFQAGDPFSSGSSAVVYFWHSVAGYSKIGTYTGNGSATGPIVQTGFEPSWVMIKRTDSSANWRILDNKRSTTNPRNKELYPNLSNAEGSFNAVDFSSNSFQVINTDGSYNASSGNYIYMAFK